MPTVLIDDILVLASAEPETERDMTQAMRRLVNELDDALPDYRVSWVYHNGDNELQFEPVEPDAPEF